MKKIIIIVLSSLVLSVAAHAHIIKTCDALLKTDDSEVAMKIEILKVANKLSAQITQEGGTLTETVDKIDNPVRAGITIHSELETLHPVERTMAHAMILTEDPILEGTQNAGLDLKLVRSARVYMIGATDGMGVFAIVEARNSTGKTLGSFVGGFLVSPCK